MTISLKIDFRGDRDYLHGTDLFAAIHAAFLKHIGVNELQAIRFKIPRFYTKAVRLEILSGKNENAVWRCEGGKKNWSGLLHEDPAAPAPGRKPFDEEDMARAIRRSSQRAELDSPSRWSAIEDTVFLGKFLNYELNPIDKTKQWVFTQLELDRSLRAGEAISVRFEKALDDFYTKSAVWTNRERLGSIYFAKIDRQSREMAGLK